MAQNEGTPEGHKSRGSKHSGKVAFEAKGSRKAKNP